jgi:hypothetical protein
MLTFKKGHYSKENLYVLYSALSGAQLSICTKAGCGDCHTCKVYKPCNDIARVLEYIATLIPERWKPDDKEHSYGKQF